MENIQFVVLLLGGISIPTVLYVYWWYTEVWKRGFVNTSNLWVKVFMCLVLTIITCLAAIYEIIMVGVVVESMLGLFS